MAALEFDKTGERFYETGAKNAVLYPISDSGTYTTGVVWNGLTNVTHSPEGAEPTDLWADDMKYATIRSAENFKCTIEAYQYPTEFNQCNGVAAPVNGMFIGQQTRKAFGLSYITQIGNDVSQSVGQKLHLLYGLTASPSELAYQTINDSPDGVQMSWECTSAPVNVTGYAPTSEITLDSRDLKPEAWTALISKLHGDTNTASLPLPDEIKKIITTASQPPAAKESRLPSNA